MMEQKNIPVTHSSMPPFEEYCEEIRSLWDSHWLSNCGEKHEQLKDQLAAYLEVPHADLFVNGHNALECTLEALELGKDGRNEVITTPFTFLSTTNAIARKGLTPVFCDIKPDDFTLDPAKIEALITPRTCAIVPVHVYGNVCDVETIAMLAETHNLRVVYDAAHAFGVRVNGVSVANFGDASMFSMHATKVFNTIEGGLVTHASDELSTRLGQWRNYGLTGQESAAYIGGNLKMNEFAAAMGLCNLRHLPGEIEKRKVASERYWDTLEQVPGIQVCRPKKGVTSNYAYLPVLFDPSEFGATRDDVFAHLKENGVFARKYFYPIISDLESYRGRYDSSLTPVAKYVGDNILTLPLYADLTREDVDRICALVMDVRGGGFSGKRDNA